MVAQVPVDPVDPVEVPASVLRAAGPGSLRPVWCNEVGGLTFEGAVRALGEGLRFLHHALPVAECPFSWSVGTRLARARDRGAPAGQEPQRWLDEAPPVDRLVVCHGDACAPNTLLDDAGRVSGHVDLGALGVADRWADLAVATWSTVWNYGPGWERPLLDAYGIDPDPDRTPFYRRLWDAT